MSEHRNEPPLPRDDERPAGFPETATLPQAGATPETGTLSDAVTPYAAADTPVFADADPLGPSSDGYAGTDDQQPSSKTAAAKDEAANLAQTAADSGGQVANTAKEQGRQVASEAADHARLLVDETRQQLSDQAGGQQQRAASGLRSLGDELGSMADSSEQPGLGAQIARQAADQTHRVAGWLDSRDPKALLEDVRGFARRRPGTFLLGAALAGLAAGRLTRAGVDNARSDDDSRSTSDPSLPVVPPGQGAGVSSPYPTPTVGPYDDPRPTGYLDPNRPVSAPRGDYGDAPAGTPDGMDSGEPLR
jgi:hypothetical protein